MKRRPTSPAARIQPIPTQDIIDLMRSRGLPTAHLERLQDTLDRSERRRKRSQRADDNRTAIGRLSEEGHSGAAIARMLGLSRCYVCEVRRELGFGRNGKPK